MPVIRFDSNISDKLLFKKNYAALKSQMSLCYVYGFAVNAILKQHIWNDSKSKSCWYYLIEADIIKKIHKIDKNS